jgi:hypothetical protein
MAAPPTANLFVDLGDEGLLQMCVMRPTPEDVCTELPFLVPAPTAPDVDAAGLSLQSQVLPAADMLAVDAGLTGNSMENTSAEPRAGCSALLIAVQEAALRGEALPADLAMVQPREWELLAANGEAPFRELDAAQLRRVAECAHSQDLCDLLLDHAFPRLLEREREEEDAAAAVEAKGLGEARALPDALSALLMILLRDGTRMDLSEQDFDLRVVKRLRAVPRLGARAATQAALTFVAHAHHHQPPPRGQVDHHHVQLRS